jgi:hypothetical protein
MAQLEPIIGLPPFFGTSQGEDENVDVDRLIIDSMPVMDIEPGMPDYSSGMQGFTLSPNDPDGGTYQKELKDIYGVSMSGEAGGVLRVAHMANNPPTETFNNDFGESFLAQLGNVASDKIRDLSFTTGAKNPADLLSGGQEWMKQKFGKGSNAFADLIGDGLGAASAGVQSMSEKSGAIGKLATGARMDFPFVWKNSSFSPSYSISVRLYNPSPSNDELTQKFMVAPLIALLMFVVPRSKDGETFRWPWCCWFSMPGMIQKYVGYVKSVTVIKGGDDNNIGYNQIPGIIDVRMDFGILYQTMLSTSANVKNDTPKLREYAEQMSSANSKIIMPANYYSHTPDIAQNDEGSIAVAPAEIVQEDRDTPPDRVEQLVVDTVNVLNDILYPS